MSITLNGVSTGIGEKRNVSHHVQYVSLCESEPEVLWNPFSVLLHSKLYILASQDYLLLLRRITNITV
jgi:hypothetical protein